MESQSLKSRVFTHAWKLFREGTLNSQFSTVNATFGKCLEVAWATHRKKDYRRFAMNIIQRFSFVDVKREYIGHDGEIVKANGTKSYWKLFRKQSKIQDDSVRELIDAGHIPLWDIFNEHKHTSRKDVQQKPVKPKRPRITYNSEKACLLS